MRRGGSAVAEPTLYLFDGYNLAHTGSFEDPRELVDLLASFVALRGARGIVVFDGGGSEQTRGPLEVRYAAHADTLLERLAAEHRDRDQVVLITSDSTVGWASGIEVEKLSSQTFLRDFEQAEHRDDRPEGLAGKLDQATRDLLEKLRRGE